MKKLLILSVLISSFVTAFAQRMEVKNLEKYDKQWIHFGFMLGFNNSDFKVTRSDNFYKNDSVLYLTPKGQLGFNLGIISNLRISDKFDLRFTPLLNFCQRNIEYRMILPQNGIPTVTKKVESTFLEFPLEIKYKSVRINNYRVYVLAGAKYMIDMVSQAKVENDKQLVKLGKTDYGYTIGFGMDFYMPLFKFAPEIKMFQGIPNVLVKDPATYTTSLSALRSRIFMISFTFE